SSLTCFPVHGVSRVRKVENRKSVQPERAVNNLGVAAHVHNHFVSVELPLGTGKFAGGNGAVIDDVVVGTGFVDDFSGEGERSGRGEHYEVAANLESGSCSDVVESPGLSCEIVSSVTSLD